MSERIDRFGVTPTGPLVENDQPIVDERFGEFVRGVKFAMGLNSGDVSVVDAGETDEDLEAEPRRVFEVAGGVPYRILGRMTIYASRYGFVLFKRLSDDENEVDGEWVEVTR